MARQMVANRNIRKVKPQSKQRAESYFDYSLLFIIIFLVGFGLLIIYSSSSYDAQLSGLDAAYYARKQFFAILLGFVLMFFTIMVDYHFWAKLYIVGYFLSIALMIAVKTPLGITRNGATRWIGVGSMSFQPAEVVKLEVILFFAVMVCKLGKKIMKWKTAIALFSTVLPFVAMLYLVTDNLSSAIIVLAIAFVIVFVATPKYKGYFAMGAAGISAVLFVIYQVEQDFIASGGAGGDSFRLTRIAAWLHPESFTSTTSFQTLQSLYAIGSGSLFGKGLGESMQKLGFLPEAQNDMIFAIICEELGLFGAVGVILLFVMMIWRFMVIANNAPDLFGSILVVGVMAHIAVQVILNIAVVTNTIPNTGISLPFISYGGTSEMFLLVEMGLVLSVSKRIRVEY